MWQLGTLHVAPALQQVAAAIARFADRRAWVVIRCHGIHQQESLRTRGAHASNACACVYYVRDYLWQRDGRYSKQPKREYTSGDDRRIERERA